MVAVTVVSGMSEADGEFNAAGSGATPSSGTLSSSSPADSDPIIGRSATNPAVATNPMPRLATRAGWGLGSKLMSPWSQLRGGDTLAGSAAASVPVTTGGVSTRVVTSGAARDRPAGVAVVSASSAMLLGDWPRLARRRAIRSSGVSSATTDRQPSTLMRPFSILAVHSASFSVWMLKNLIFTFSGPFCSTSYTQPVPA